MKLNKEDKGKCGIYCIKNVIDSKIYVGKSKDIYRRIQEHIYSLRHKRKDENRHLINAWHKYGKDAFEYSILEETKLDESILKERELYWMNEYKSIDKKFGYNLRMDSSTKMIVHEETKKLLSKANSGENNPNFGNRWSDEQKMAASKHFKELYTIGVLKPNPENGRRGSKTRNEKWKKDPTLKEKMKKKTSVTRTKHKFYQYNKDTNVLIKVWDSIYDILSENPNWKRHNIYAACSGEKPSIYGYKWKKIKNDDIVQS